jgi:dephospho-CoA kinase
MKVIGAIGRNASGKDEFVEYLREQRGVPTLSIGAIVRDIAAEEDVRPTRDNLHKISQRHMDRYGKTYFAERLVEKIKEQDWDRVAVTGIRSPADVATLKEEFDDDFTLVHVRVGDPRIRFERSRDRDEPRDPKSFEKFLQQDEEEEQLFNLHEAIEEADLTVDNSGSLEQFHEVIEVKVVEPILKARHQRSVAA